MKGGYTVADFEKSFVPFQHCSVYYDCGEINIVINKACNAWMVNATWSFPASFLESSTLPSTITWSECGRLLLPAVWLASKATAVTPNLNAAGYKLRLQQTSNSALSTVILRSTGELGFPDKWPYTPASSWWALEGQRALFSPVLPL